MDNKIFETIYRENEPLEITESERRLFEKVYFECNVKPFEQILREANEQNYVYRSNPKGEPDTEYPYIGLFPPEILEGKVCASVIKPQLWASAVYKVYAEYQKLRNYILLPCDEKHRIPTENLDKRAKLHNDIKTAMINAHEHEKNFPSKIEPEKRIDRQRNKFKDSAKNDSTE
jgi:hypothetical protein